MGYCFGWQRNRIRRLNLLQCDVGEVSTIAEWWQFHQILPSSRPCIQILNDYFKYQLYTCFLICYLLLIPNSDPLSINSKINSLQIKQFLITHKYKQNHNPNQGFCFSMGLLTTAVLNSWSILAVTKIVSRLTPNLIDHVLSCFMSSSPGKGW